MDFGSLGERKRAIFCITPVNDGSMNYLVSMLFTQCFQELYLRADERYDGRLPVPVRVIQDEWANVPQPDSYPKVLATCRSYNIGIDIIVQNIQSIKARYRDECQSIIGNCDTLLFWAAATSRNRWSSCRSCWARRPSASGQGARHGVAAAPAPSTIS